MDLPIVWLHLSFFFITSYCPSTSVSRHFSIVYLYIISYSGKKKTGFKVC